jgi:hypothetical protein
MNPQQLLIRDALSEGVQQPAKLRRAGKSLAHYAEPTVETPDPPRGGGVTA